MIVSASASPTEEAPTGHHPTSALRTLVWAALGVVFGDVGTSPLYAMSETVSSHLSAVHGIKDKVALRIGEHYGKDEVLGWTSLFFWSLAIVVTVKYVVLHHAGRQPGRGRPLLAPRASAVIGAALLFGDGIVTPAISVLSAIEGLQLVAPSVHRYIVPLTVVILVGPLRHPALRHGLHRAALRPGDGAVVQRHRAPRRLCTSRRTPGVLEALSPAPRGALPRPPRLPRLQAPRLGGARGDGRRGPLRRHGPLRPQAHPPRVAGAGLPRAAPLLPGAGGAPAGPHPAAAAQPFFNMVPRGPGGVRARRPRRARHGHRVAGAHLGGVLAHPAGHPAGVLPARRGEAHLGRGRGADLRPRPQLDARRRVHPAGAGVPALVAPRRGLRARRQRHHGHHSSRVAT
jgi:hypothetical protein